MRPEKGELTAVDLFCGAGGMACGLKEAGVRVCYAADSWKAAVSTYNSNFSETANEAPLTFQSELPTAPLFTGGPPCQGFSSAGVRRPNDVRNSLVAVFAHLVRCHLPQAFVFENVEGFLTGDGGKWVLDLLVPLVEAGYSVGLRKVNAANYGVPQHRKRVFVVGGLGWYPGFPPATNLAFGAPGATLIGRELSRATTLRDALEGMPAAVPRGERPALADHDYKIPNPDDLVRYAALGEGQTMKDLPEHLWHETYRRRAFRRVKDGTPTERRGGAPAGIRRLHWDRPSKAITSGAPSEFVHPQEHRTLTLRECARVQTFPDSFHFSGTQSERALQIGNAVPPLLATRILAHVADGLRLSRVTTSPGLHELTLTNSSGLSPALLRTQGLVRERLGEGKQPTQIPLFAESHG